MRMASSYYIRTVRKNCNILLAHNYEYDGHHHAVVFVFCVSIHTYSEKMEDYNTLEGSPSNLYTKNIRKPVVVKLCGYFRAPPAPLERQSRRASDLKDYRHGAPKKLSNEDPFAEQSKTVGLQLKALPLVLK